MNPTRQAYFTEHLKATPEELQKIEKLDPTTNALNGAWLLRGIREDWFRDVKNEDVNNALLNFERLKDSPAFKGVYSSDINQHTWETLTTLSKDYWELLSNKQKLRQPKGCELVFEEDLWKVYRCFEPEAAVSLGSNTSWCTTSLSTAQEYLKTGNLWVYRLLDEPYAQLHRGSGQFQNRFNNSVLNGFLGSNVIADSDLDRITHTLAEKYTDVALFENSIFPLPKLPEDQLQLLTRKTPEVLRRALPMFDARKRELEKILFGGSRFATREFHNLVAYFAKFKEKDPELEGLLLDSKDPVPLLAYALTLRRNRWEEAEGLISESSDGTLNKIYRRYVSKYVGLAQVTFQTIGQVNDWLPTLHSKCENLFGYLANGRDIRGLDLNEYTGYLQRIGYRDLEAEKGLANYLPTDTFLAYLEKNKRVGLVEEFPEQYLEKFLKRIPSWNPTTTQAYCRLFFSTEQVLELFEKIRDLKLEPQDTTNLFLGMVGPEAHIPWLDEIIKTLNKRQIKVLDTKFLDFIIHNEEFLGEEVIKQYWQMVNETEPYHHRLQIVHHLAEGRRIPGLSYFLKISNLSSSILYGIRDAAHKMPEEMKDFLWNSIRERKDINIDLLGQWSLSLGRRLAETEERTFFQVSGIMSSLQYIEKFFKRGERCAEVEKSLKYSDNVERLIRYAQIVGRVQELEEYILENMAPRYITAYADQVLGSWWPEALYRLNGETRCQLQDSRRNTTMIQFRNQRTTGWLPELEQFNVAEIREGIRTIRDGKRIVGFTTYLSPSLLAENLMDIAKDPRWAMWMTEWRALTEEERKKVIFPRVKKVKKEKENAPV